MPARLRAWLLRFALAGALGCGGAGGAEEERPLPPPSGGGEQDLVDDGRQIVTLPDDGSLGQLEDVLERHRADGTPVLRIVIHTARSAEAGDAESYLDSIRALVRRHDFESEVLIGAPADAPHLTLVTRHPAPIGP